MKTLKSDPEDRELLSSTGMQPSLSEESHHDMEQFGLTKMYGCLPGSTCAEAKAQKWRKQKNKKNTLCLPLDSDSLYHHLRRENYLPYCLKNFELRENPSPIMNGWKDENGKCMAARHTCGPRTTVSQDVQTRFSVPSAFAKFLSKIKGILWASAVSMILALY